MHFTNNNHPRQQPVKMSNWQSRNDNSLGQSGFRKNWHTISKIDKISQISQISQILRPGVEICVLGHPQIMEVQISVLGTIAKTFLFQNLCLHLRLPNCFNGLKSSLRRSFPSSNSTRQFHLLFRVTLKCAFSSTISKNDAQIALVNRGELFRVANKSDCTR